MEVDEQVLQALLNAKDHTIELLEVKAALLEQLAESHRLNLIAQSQELAEHRRFDECRKHMVGFFFFCFLRDVWPFKLIWKYKY